ncbi:uncharacterized protein TOT_030000702 [Theileria orientalis strain Shintoku]|uniref:SfiI-subtelomeric related protein family member n=1 Tax=Theileria orientalis strain Shintoku TaxID=869250 RepID=J4C424_THEOR|nr:uncharacterized protein TOT_030000702 [Theileria orientalis strain Shintoku]BAM41441.1 uncharacterized protein TOT_030000702 [Theileria orientalis strain Shintoku]|eukprot:XP_009691742.1 uncharacterized protein TOT_030000702 [Theileria orientalis strain Shintoku]
MYTYKLYVFVIYLLSLRWTVCASGEEAVSTKTNITFDLRKLKEHGGTSEATANHNVKHTTFTTPEGKVVDKVVYDTVDVWVATNYSGKTLKKLVVTDKRHVLQLLDVVLVNSAADAAQEEHVYYKKQKKEFKVIQERDYKVQKGQLSGRPAMLTDPWFIYDFGDKESYSKFVGQNNYLLDGVWKTTYSPYHGKPSLIRDGTQQLWTLGNDGKHVTRVDIFEFDADKLLVLYVGDFEGKYFHKLKTASQWTSLESESVFNTKANEFKTKYFTTELEYDLAVRPDYNKFLVNRSTVGNLNYLTLFPTKAYSLNKLKFGNEVLWSSDNKENRVYAMKLTLLGYEVKTVQLAVTKGATKLDPQSDVYYYHKDTSNTFKTKTKEEYQAAVDSVKASSDRNASFTYLNTWEQVASKLDLLNYNPEEFTVQTTEGTGGVVTVTLTPKENMWFSSVGFGTVNVWPPSDNSVNNPAVKRVVVVKKNSLLQLVHLTASGTVTLENAGAVDTDYFFKKNGDAFDTVENSTTFDSHKTSLQGEGGLLDPHVHLDVNTEQLDETYYTVTTNREDGVDKKVVAVKTLKVTKLTNFKTDLWTKPSGSSDSHATGYEMYTFGEKKLLKVLVNNGASSTGNTTFEKSGANAQWTAFSDNFNSKLLAMKTPSNWESVELDVSVSPSLTNFDVVATRLKGNRTKLLLTPKKNKKVTKVKLGTTKDFFTTADDNRAHKVELYLETYEAKFVKVFVWKDVTTDNTHQLTEEKHFHNGTNWVTENFDEKLKEFEAEDNTVPFTYSENWVRPPTTFDPKAFSETYFGKADATAELVKTTTYTPREGTAVNKVSLYGDKVWPDGDQPDATKKLVELKVLSKNDMVQLVHLTNAVVATPSTSENLYYKKVTDRYEKLANENEFNMLKNSLSKADEYVDDKVKLDLSATEEASTKLFEKETTLEDGVEKTVVTVKAGKLFEVSASPALWTSTDGSYVTKLERYALDGMQLLVLHITKPSGTTETKYFEKPLSPPVAPSQPALNDKTAFFAKLNKAKAAVTHQDVSLDVQAYNTTDKYEVKQVTEGTATLFKVYPKKTYRVTGLVNGSGNNLWTKSEDGERLVEAFFYVHESNVKFVRAVVWAKDHTDESKDKLLHYKLENGRFVDKDATAFAKELRELTTVPLTPLATETIVQPPPTPSLFRKFYLSDNVDPKVFELTERKKGEYKLKNYTPKQDMFVNMVETQHGVLWKASNVGDVMKSTFFAVKDDTALAHLTVVVNSLPTHLFFKFDTDRWLALDSNTYVDLYTKAGLTSASR